MTEQEQIAYLEKRIKKLAKRLKEKMKYEKAMLINSGATPQYIADIEAKDRKALEP